MKVLIVEDEKPAADMLELLLHQLDASIQVVHKSSAISECVCWMKENANHTDLIFMDIQLSDGLCFEIFRQIPVRQPVIFTTAFNQYAIEAFKVNSIDYLLKPVKQEDLSRSLQKLSELQANLTAFTQPSYHEIYKVLTGFRQNYLSRILVKVGDHIRAFDINNIVLFYAEGRTVYLWTQENRRYIVDYTLDNLVAELNPDTFFRCNRSVILHIDYIREAVVYSSTRLKIKLHVEFDQEIIVSRERVAPFKKWFAGIKNH